MVTWINNNKMLYPVKCIDFNRIIVQYNAMVILCLYVWKHRISHKAYWMGKEMNSINRLAQFIFILFKLIFSPCQPIIYSLIACLCHNVYEVERKLKERIKSKSLSLATKKIIIVLLHQRAHEKVEKKK